LWYRCTFKNSVNFFYCKKKLLKSLIDQLSKLIFEIRTLKKEISLRQSALNRREVVSEEYMEQVMKEELRVWHEKVNAFSKQIKDAEIFMKLPKLSDE